MPLFGCACWQKPGSKQSSKPDVAEVSIQDEGGDVTTAQVDVTQKSPAQSQEVIMEFEDEFETSIPDDQAEKILTVGNAIDFIKQANGTDWYLLRNQ